MRRRAGRTYAGGSDGGRGAVCMARSEPRPTREAKRASLTKAPRGRRVRAVAEIDDELIARAIRWCAEAGSKASPDEVRTALAPLSWDELLAARALLADP